MFCLLIVVTFISLFYKELKMMAFDSAGSKLLGFRPKLLHLIWLEIVSAVAVTAFEVAGTIMVVALMIVPAATANILTNRLSMIFKRFTALACTSCIYGAAYINKLHDNCSTTKWCY